MSNDLELGKSSSPAVDSATKQSLILLCSEKAAYIYSFVHAVQVAIIFRHSIELFFHDRKPTFLPTIIVPLSFMTLFLGL